MKIRWQEAELDETGFMAGHGLGFYRMLGEAAQERRLLAFVDDVSALRDEKDLVVLFTPARWPIDEAERKALQQAVEDFLRAGHVYGDFAPGYFAFMNA